MEVGGTFTHQQQLSAWLQGGTSATFLLQLWASTSYCSFSWGEGRKGQGRVHSEWQRQRGTALHAALGLRGQRVGRCRTGELRITSTPHTQLPSTFLAPCTPLVIGMCAQNAQQEHLATACPLRPSILWSQALSTTPKVGCQVPTSLL